MAGAVAAAVGDSYLEKQWLRVKGRLVSRELREGPNSLIASDAMGGKTSLLKQLCLDAIAENCVAIFLTCEESSKVDDPKAIKKWIKASVEDQYGKTSLKNSHKSVNVKFSLPSTICTT